MFNKNYFDELPDDIQDIIFRKIHQNCINHFSEIIETPVGSDIYLESMSSNICDKLSSFHRKRLNSTIYSFDDEQYINFIKQKKEILKISALIRSNYDDDDCLSKMILIDHGDTRTSMLKLPVTLYENYSDSDSNSDDSYSDSDDSYSDSDDSYSNSDDSYSD